MTENDKKVKPRAVTRTEFDELKRELQNLREWVEGAELNTRETIQGVRTQVHQLFSRLPVAPVRKNGGGSSLRG